MASSRLRVVADALLPNLGVALGPWADVCVRPAAALTREALADADALLVRSVTRVTPALLRGTPVRFVGSATAGTDHLDLPGLAAAGVVTAHAPGSNAASVVDHVLAGLLALAADRGETLGGRTLGVVGVGAVGGRLAARARALGMRVLACDPPRAEAGHADHHYVALADLLATSDVVSLHVPLADGGRWPTRGLVGAHALAAMRPGAWLVNAARGEVVDGAALVAARARLGAIALDCWPGEPSPPDALADAVDLASPHVAGHATDAKRRGTTVMAAALAAWASANGWDAPVRPLPEPAPRHLDAPPADAPAWLDALARQACDVRAEDARFRAAMRVAPSGPARAAAFASLRAGYPGRREMSRCVVRGHVPPEHRAAVADGLGMRLAAR